MNNSSLKKNIIVSFPRSGQHLFGRILQHYCGKHSIEYSYCDFYPKGNCGCGTVPCRKDRLFQKSHDLSLQVEVLSNFRYLVIYRQNMLEQLEAYFRFCYQQRKNQNLEGVDRLPDYSNAEVRLNLLSFAARNANYYSGFVKKWVLRENENIFRVEYDSVVQDPRNILSVYKFFFPDIDHSRDEEVLDDFLRGEPLRKKGNGLLPFLSQKGPSESEALLKRDLGLGGSPQSIQGGE